VRLRQAGAKDSDAVTACVHAAYACYLERIGRPPGPMTDDYAKLIGEGRVTVADEEGKIVGVLVLSATSQEFLLENVAVHPMYQGRGIGRQLIAYAEAHAHRDGFAFIHLYTHEKMTENQAMYARMGYVEYDRRTEQGFARVFMRKALR
jgi:ribosomal protein S18 acetylase RimI-like enzyme